MIAENGAACGKRLFYVQWHITHRCNLRCVHCYQDDYTACSSENELSSALDKIDRFLKSRRIPGQINLTGGEPLCHPSFFDLSREIVNRGIRLGILTNGTLIDDEAARSISSLHPVFVQISLDGSRPIHEKIRGKGSYDAAFRGVDALKSYGVKVLISFTAQKSNVGSFPDLAEECAAHSVDKLWWDRVVPDSPETVRDLALSADEFGYMLKQTKKLRSRYGKSGMNVDDKRALQFLCERGSSGYRCGAGRDLIVILADGSVMPCRRLPFVIGNIKDSSLGKIINESSLMRELRTHLPPEECFSCKYLSKCEGGAKCVTYAVTGELYARDVNCPIKLKR